MKQFGGEVLFLDRNDINTDEILPARYLTELTKEALKPYLLEDLSLEGFSTQDIKNKGAILSRNNFGCGSSREHAPWALEQSGICVVIAESFARIFRQNMFNCGMLAIALPSETITEVFDSFCGQKTILTMNMEKSELIFKSEKRKMEIPFVLPPFDKALIEAGGWLNYADSRY